MRLSILILFLSVTVLGCHAQEQSFSDGSFLRNLIADVYDYGPADDGDAVADEEGVEDNLQQLIEDVTEQLQDIASQHLNLNTLDLEALSAIPLLSEQQAMAILHYRALYGDLRSAAELSLITALDEPHRRLLRHLFTFSPTPSRPYIPLPEEANDSSLMTQPAYHRTSSLPHGISFDIGIPTYTRKGYQTPIGMGGYHGYNLMHTLRYRYRHRNVQAAFTAAQNYGEPFFSGTNGKGYDFYTGFARIRNQGFLEDLVIGHYQLSVGMGLIMNKRMRSTRTMLLTSVPDVRMNISGHASRSSSNYLQGIATKLRLPYNLQATLFASYNSLDASITPTSASQPSTFNSQPSVTSILTSGYHRTDTEIARRNTLHETVLGGSLAWHKAPYYLALTLLNTHYDLPLRPTKTQFYRYFYPQGNDFLNASLSYGYTSSRLLFTGETAISPQARYTKDEGMVDAANGSDGMSFATSNSLRWRLTETFSLFALHRFLSYRFQGLHGKTMSANSAVRNENGFYLGATLSSLPHLTLSAYIDYAYHPWAVYGISYPYGISDGKVTTTTGTKDTESVPPLTSRTWEHQVQAEYSRSLHFADLNIQLRYRYRDNALTENPYYGTAAMVMPMTEDILKGQHTLRLKARLRNRAWWTMAQIHYTHATDNPKATVSNGFLSALSGGVGRSFAVNASLAYFHTDDYASRLYVQEPSLAYGTGTAMLYGHGLRTTITTTCKTFHDRLSLAAQVSLDHYFDRTTIGSGMQMIDGSSKCDIFLHAAFSF